MPIGVAIIGSGLFAREQHKPAIDAAPTLTLKAVYSRSLKSAQSLTADSPDVGLFSDDAGAGQSLDDLLSRSDIQAVTIALPIKIQPQYVRKALSAGKHVLSEKPVAENVKDAKDLIQWYQDEIVTKGTGITWGVAENFRFMDSFAHAAKARESMGRALTFKVRMQNMVSAGGKYFETEWRKTPSHQGGFLLDGGVHFVAGLRLLLGPSDPLTSVSANIAQLQPHLPPVDTIEATARSKSGSVGSISISFGTTSKGTEYLVASERGPVSVSFSKVTVGDKVEEIEDENAGVPAEMKAWGQALKAGRADPRQSPQQALADLEVIEACLRSGEAGGIPTQLQYQQF